MIELENKVPGKKTTKLCFKHLVPRRNPNQNLSKIYSDLLEIKFDLPKNKFGPISEFHDPRLSSGFF